MTDRGEATTAASPALGAALEQWPALPYDAWKETYATLHMWTQVVGKIALARTARVNHSWGVAFLVTPRGLQTHLLTQGSRSFTIAFDFVDHQLVVETCDAVRGTLPLASRSVAEFYRGVMQLLDGMNLSVRIWPVPVEVPTPIRFDEDTIHQSYQHDAVERWWRIVFNVHQVLTACRCTFVGKCSPVHFFWGAFDLAVTRFSGRRAPPREGPAFMREAYSHEVISHGFWPGSPPVLEPSFYAYAVPEPDGLKTASIEPAAGYYHPELGEFILPYDAVRTAASPEGAIAAFVDSTYERAATLAGWDRRTLERAAMDSGR